MENNIENRPQKKIKTKLIVSLITVLVVLISFVGGYFFRYLIEKKEVTVTSDLVRIIEKFGYVFDPKTGEMRELTESDYADALVNGLLDEYSAYYDEQEYEALKQKSKGNYSGYGFSIYTESNVIYGVTGNSPAELSGLKAGDKITSASIDGGEFVTIIKATDLTSLIATGSENSVLNLTVDRDGEFSGKSFSFSAYDFTASYVSYFDNELRFVFRTDGDKLKGVSDNSERMSVLSADTAYIKLDHFEGGAAEQLKQALDFMKERGRTKLILDLRGNGGGYMDVLTEVASYLIYNNGEKNTAVARVESKTGNETYSFKKSNFYENIEEIAVLANSDTASASECLIGAMLTYGDKFNKDNLIIEKNADGVARTYGKGIMQTTYWLLKGGAFKLTTARVLWPDKTTCIHGVGIIAEGANATEKGNSAILRAVEVLS